MTFEVQKSRKQRRIINNSSSFLLRHAEAIHQSLLKKSPAAKEERTHFYLI
jgi:hypothetical protein